jgi:hypothetical protein
MDRWQKYRFLGADLQIRKLYQKLQIFECICYFAAFFALGFGVQVSLHILEIRGKLIASLSS